MSQFVDQLKFIGAVTPDGKLSGYFEKRYNEFTVTELISILSNKELDALIISIWEEARYRYSGKGLNNTVADTDAEIIGWENGNSKT